MVLHGGRGVEDGQGRVHLGLERVVRPTVVQVVAKASHQQSENLEREKTFNYVESLFNTHVFLGGIMYKISTLLCQVRNMVSSMGKRREMAKL